MQIEVSRRVAANVRAELARQGMRQAQAAERMNRSQAWLSRRLTGDVPLSLDDLGALAVVLDVPLATLLPEVAA